MSESFLCHFSKCRILCNSEISVSCGDSESSDLSFVKILVVPCQAVNKVLSENMGRVEAELEMAQNQRESCKQVDSTLWIKFCVDKVA